MSSKAEKVMVVGIDAPIVPRLIKWAREGKLPTIKKFLDEGVFAPNCLAPFPTITPPNWTTLATGAWAGTHGITDFDFHVPGDPLDKIHQAFDAREILAETIWQAAARAGKKAILVNYPTTWHTQLDGWQIGGYGLNINDYRLGSPKELVNLNNLTYDVLLSTEAYPFGTEIAWQKAQGWQDVEHSPKALEASATLAMRRTLHKVAPVTWQLLLDQSEGKGYDKLLVATAKDKGGVFARLRAGEWTPNIYQAFQTDAGPVECVFRMKLIELSPDGQQFRLFVPAISALHGWGLPAEIEDEIKMEDGMPLGKTPWDSWLLEWVDNQTLVETVDLHNVWLGKAAAYLLKNKPWDLFYCHIHTPDSMYHTFSVDIDPLTAKHPERIADTVAMEMALYESVDRCVASIVEAADDKTVVVIVSDHGAKAAMNEFHVNDALAAAGLVAYKPGTHEVDWSHTKASEQRTVYVYVNTRGRDPQGIVEPGEEYEKVREQVVKALLEYVEPKTGLHPISLALKKEDARILGLYGDRVGDVVFAFRPEFYMEHGPHLTTTRFGEGDLRTLFIMKGPGVKQGVEVERNVWLTDVVPTLCHLAELPVPKQCEGSIIYQSLEDPDAQVKELQSLRRNVERLQRMVERPPMC
ncbi:MAG: alkaline phosphatase family protein [Chloroflexi bacterium]|nr:alkaline phosphatase family protein [Chloroflexota bacterium]MDA8218610.1 alkaline phosphatase family protein [Dehalococcoidales bacterium]